MDVIVVTAAKDADSVRVAMQGGALHYLLKPFSFPVLRDKLLSYAQMRTRLGSLRDADQRNVDRVFGALRAPDQLSACQGPFGAHPGGGRATAQRDGRRTCRPPRSPSAPA